MVKVNGILSDLLCLSTGSPQGCVLSPLLYILYTNMCQSKHANNTVQKFASFLQDNESGHGSIIEKFVIWCDESYLELNLTKTKDMIIDFRTRASLYDTTIIKDQVVDCVESYTYLGTLIDSKLTFEKNCETLCKKGHQHLFCLRKLSRFHIDKAMMTPFYWTY